MNSLLTRLREALGLPSTPDSTRWVVVDTETTGLDPTRDQLLSIGAVALNHGRLVLADSFEAVIKSQTQPSGENVLIHGIGHQQHAGGEPLAQALQAWERWRDGAPLIACHAEFDRRVLQHAARSAGLRPTRGLWLDPVLVAAALHPDEARSRASLDDWLDYFQIPVAQRHSAVGDALATAELILRLLPQAEREGFSGFKGLMHAARSTRWQQHRARG
jgi:DNA polymerase III subunit epsilon